MRRRPFARLYDAPETSRGREGAVACILLALLASAAAAQPTVSPQTPPEKPRAAAPAVVTIPGPKDLKFPPLRAVQPPNLVSATLPNGMKISLLEDHDLPTIHGVALVRAGSLLDPPEKIGLAALTGTLLRSGGTAAKTPDQMDNMLETMAASIDSGADESSIRAGFAALKENAGAVLGLLRETLAQPEFRQDKLDVLRAQMRAAIAQRNDDATRLVHREFASAIYGRDNPYGWVSQYANVDRISRNDVRAFYRRYFFPANVTLALWGDFEAASMKAAIEKEFAGWNEAAQPAPVFPQVKDAPAPGVYLAEIKDTGNAYFAIGHLDGRIDDKDLPALQIMSTILGNGPRGRLAEKARAKTGAPHEIRASWIAAHDHPGLFEISGSTRGVGAVDVIKVIQGEIERIRTTEVTEEELRDAREGLLNATVFAFDTKAKLITRSVTLDYFGYPKDYVQQYQKALQAVTRADVLRVAKQHIAPAKLTIVVAVNPQMLGEPLSSLGGTVSTIDLTIPEARAEAVETTDASRAEGKLLLQKAQAAMGGAERLAAVKDYTETASYQLDVSVPNMGGATVSETDRWIAPTSFRQESVLPGGRVAVYTDGKLGWITTPQGWGALSGIQQKQVYGDLFRSWFRLILSDRIEGRTVNAVDSTSVEIIDGAGQEAKIEFDPASGLPRRITYDTPQPVGAPLFTEDVVEDYREVDGIKLPFKATINQSGRRFAEVTVTEYKINSGLKVPDLARRPM
jgi:zinc protease